MAEVGMGELKILSGCNSNPHVKTSLRKALAPWRFISKCSQSPSKTECRQSGATIPLKEDFSLHRVNLNSMRSNSYEQVGSTRRKALAPWRFQPRIIRPSPQDINAIEDLPDEVPSSAVKEIHKSPATPEPGKCNSSDIHMQQSYREKLRSSVKKEHFSSPETIGSQMPRVYPSRVRISTNDSSINGSRTDCMHGNNFEDGDNGDSSNTGTSRKRKVDDVHIEDYTIESTKKATHADPTDAPTINGTGHPNGDDSHLVGCLNLFRKIYKNLLDKEDLKPPENRISRIDLLGLKLFREKHNGLLGSRKFSGSIPGAKVGDVYHLRVELYIAGLHCHVHNVVDCMEQDENSVAISLVANIQNPSDDIDSDLLEYCGSEVLKGEKLDGGNLALKNSMDAKVPVRVIYSFTKYRTKDCEDVRTKKFMVYIYDGLYLVEKCWRKKTDENHSLVMFQLRRKMGQRMLDFKELVKSASSTSSRGIYIEDISRGSEKIPISAVNYIDDEYPKEFKYVPQMTYPSKCSLTPSSGCECVDGCSDSVQCACSVKNGGEIPFNFSGGIVEIKPLVYECGPSCKCPPSCHNRVSQQGIKFTLQVFKTKSMGWGVRSLTAIPCGSFVCEYVGELLTDDEAEKRTTDEYLFNIGNNYYDDHWEGESYSIPSLSQGPLNKDEVGFAIDASKAGNVGRFINHSCSPNLYAQNLLYDHEDTNIPRIMFFASDDIPPLQELTYDYNYKIDSVRDANGNIKRKYCHCGSVECTGRLY